jgi:hypothetical protein
MSEEQIGPLNPDSEQQLFEKLSLSEEDLKLLNYIRRHVKIIVKQEQNGKMEKNNT